MNPVDLIGLPYRLGADPVKHGAADCVSLARTVLQHYGIESPSPKRDWYRRLKRGDTAVFPDELKRWGVMTDLLDCGVVALCRTDAGGFGLAAWWSEGWLNFSGSEVVWSPIGVLPVVERYCQRKQNSAILLG